MRNTLIIFARAPRLGRVKRRLAAGIGDQAAYRFHRLTTETLIRRLAPDRRWRTLVATTPEACRWPRFVRRFAQRGTTLGGRMSNAVRAAPSGPVVLVGTDVPAVGTAHVARAFRALASRHVVFGAARDGGFWLIGVRDRSILTRLFRGVRWSTPHALEDTLANLGGRTRHALVDTLEDVDDVEAYRQWQRCAVR